MCKGQDKRMPQEVMSQPLLEQKSDRKVPDALLC